MSIFLLLVQFVFRVTFGVALAMGITPARKVSSGFFRVHLWVLMGMATLAGLTIYTQREPLSHLLGNSSVVLGIAIGLVLLTYVTAVTWLYEKHAAGKIGIFLVMLGGIAAAILATPAPGLSSAATTVTSVLDTASSGLLLGATLTAMFLGHWYLNTPTMELMPLKRLVLLMGAAVVARALVSGTGLWLEAQSQSSLQLQFWIFVALRWLSGLIGTLAIAVMAWYSLQVPNTQSATGILYAGVILAFIGELTAQFLSADAMYPL